MIFIKVEVYGNHVNHLWHVKTNQEEIVIDGEEKLVFTAKPQIEILNSYDYEKISEFESDSSLVSNPLYITKMFFEDEEVSLLNRKFRVDTGVLEMYISKVLSETDDNKNNAEIELNAYLKAFNEDMILSNERLRKYCDVHKLKPNDTDVFKLWDIVYPENDFNIMDGKMVCVPNPGKDDFMITGIATKADVTSTTGMLGTLSKTYCEACHRIDTTVSSAMV